ncbi:MAG: hypothetical protein OEZ39_19820 [Gammaproteobacteria bacterium]|nr:hypothetical protein [Gammaproteobacteria bacterium]MDH5654116.1 hypothetical protein [Gammaproteobacteria bacterium]
MEQVRGTVSNVRNSVSISGGGENSRVKTTHIVVFRIAARQIKIKSGEPLMINEGDEVFAVGYTRSGILIFGVRVKTLILLVGVFTLTPNI